MKQQDTDAIEMFVDYQRAQNLAATTIRNRRSILTTFARKTGTLVECDIFTLRRYVGRADDVKAGTRRRARLDRSAASRSTPCSPQGHTVAPAR